MRTFTLCLLAILLAVPTAQARKKPAVQLPRFDMSAHYEFTQTGGASIQGQAFLRQRGGGVVTCAGSDVLLLPDTSFFRAVIEAAKRGQRFEANATVDSQAQTVARHTLCDAQGHFHFEQLPPARWIVMTPVQWSVGYDSQGGVLLQAIQTDGISTMEVLLSDRDRVGL